ncbi:hypothetical protein [Sphingomicrobium astaxanthinifaciens]|uniref:hypothetical protein n=1 Tax=Sphingomicrobium astaxanthinifaciens TaxID=1227949 RepID=UPI001FCB62AA|nr:hypothetical protein [Sphingomicrobium astaxanthinifaciens]MCJ7420446.1 hypothetical protein [Sphingomicrobium astaxanthinifaciens]
MMKYSGLLLAGLFCVVGSSGHAQDRGGDWATLQADVASFNDGYKLTYHQDYLYTEIVGSVAIARDDDGRCRFSFSKQSSAIVPENNKSLTETWKVADFTVEDGDDFLLITLPFQTNGEEPLAADFPKNLVIAVQNSEGKPKIITSKKTYFSGRELIDDPTEPGFFVYDRAITADITGEIQTQPLIAILKNAATQCGFALHEREM